MELGKGGPEYNWSLLGNYADAVHRQEWDKMAVAQSYADSQSTAGICFRGSSLAALNFTNGLPRSPGERLNISWTPMAGAGFIPHVPWGLMYTADLPPEGQPVDPMGFLGLRCRVAYNSHVAAPAEHIRH